MALLALAQVKLYLRKQTTAEDTLLAALLASAIGIVEAHLRRPIIATEREFVDEATDTFGGCVRALLVPVTPVGSICSIADADGEELDTELLRVGKETGLVKYLDGSSFTNGPYTITANVGLSHREGYATRIEPAINQAILDVVADLYQRRSPAASQETAGGGVSTAFTQGNHGGVPDRVAAMLAPFRMVGVA
jgi:uncharacterized phiE125 gp8 family phage protein